MAMTQKILVVGGAGYIGGAVTDILLTKKVPFAVYDNLTYEPHYLKPVEFIYGDIRDRKKLKKILPLFSHIIWLAAIVGDGACAIKPSLTKEVNEDAVAFLADTYAGRVLFTSTCSVYGKNLEPVTEESLTNPLSVYATTKLAAENYLKKNNSLIFRLGTAFGLSDNFSRIRMDLAINYMTMKGIEHKKLTIFGGKQWRPFIHVKDIGRVLVENLFTTHRGVYNLAMHNATVLEIAKSIQRETRCKIKLTDKKFQDDRSYNALVDKGIKDKVFTLNTRYSISEGIKEVKKLVLSNRIKNLSFEMYSNERSLLLSIATYENSL